MEFLIGLQSVSGWERFTALLRDVFGGDTADPPFTLYQVAARAALVYVVGLAIVRIGKSRMIGRNTALDVILGFILGSLLSRGITGHASLSGTAMACAVLVAAHWTFTAIAYHSHAFGALIKGHERPLVEDGRLLKDNMRRSHISEHDLGEELRIQGVEDLEQVKLAMKERNGQIGVIKKKPAPRVVEVAVRDGVQTVRIKLV